MTLCSCKAFLEFGNARLLCPRGAFAIIAAVLISTACSNSGESDPVVPPTISEPGAVVPSDTSEPASDAPTEMSEPGSDVPPDMAEPVSDVPPDMSEPSSDVPPEMSEPGSDVPSDIPESGSDVPPDMPEPASDVPPDMPEPVSDVPPDMSEPSSDVPPDMPEPGSDVPPDTSEPGSDVPPDTSEPGSDVPPDMSEPVSDVPPTAPESGFTLTQFPSAVSVVEGEQAVEVTVSVTRTAGFDAEIALQIEPLFLSENPQISASLEPARPYRRCRERSNHTFLSTRSSPKTSKHAGTAGACQCRYRSRANHTDARSNPNCVTGYLSSDWAKQYGR